MDDNRTMAQLLEAPTEGYEDAIVVPEINANFELKHAPKTSTSVILFSIHESISEPANAPVRALRPNKKQQIHFLQEEMMKDVREKANDKIMRNSMKSFWENLSFELKLYGSLDAYANSPRL
ncbi:hypothetical protein Tco_0340932 [Tanacetum coccineum]